MLKYKCSVFLKEKWRSKVLFFIVIKIVCLILGDFLMEGLNVIFNSICIFNIVVFVYSLLVN